MEILLLILFWVVTTALFAFWFSDLTALKRRNDSEMQEIKQDIEFNTRFYKRITPVNKSINKIENRLHELETKVDNLTQPKE